MIEDYKTDDVLLMFGDCVERMKDIDTGAVDLTVTSPPYDNLRKYNDSLAWNETIWRKVFDELYRVTADGGVVVWIVADKCIDGGESGTSFKQALYAQSIGFKIYDTMIWNKPSPQTPTESRYYDVFEYMFVFSKGKPKTLNLLKDRRNKSAGNVSNKETRSCREDRVKLDTKRTVAEFSRRFNVWDVSRGMNNTEHPAVFPDQLAKDHILSWSNEGDTVLDPFTGSGTTGRMAHLVGRKFIGVEKVEEYFNMASSEINNVEAYVEYNEATESFVDSVLEF